MSTTTRCLPGLPVSLRQVSLCVAAPGVPLSTSSGPVPTDAAADKAASRRLNANSITQYCQLTIGLRVQPVSSKTSPPVSTALQPFLNTRPWIRSRPRPGEPTAVRTTSRLTLACHCFPSAQTASQPAGLVAHHVAPSAIRQRSFFFSARHRQWTRRTSRELASKLAS